jgi:hypothetical protein
MNKNGYPEKHELEKIRNWPVESGWHGLLNYVRGRWYHSDYFYKQGNTYLMSTYGWSGNMQLIMALDSNRLFWNTCWISSEKGGHYKFEVPEIV